MKNGGNKHINPAGLLLLFMIISDGAWIALIIAKTCGSVRMNWIAVLLGAFWLPALVLAFSLGIAGLLVLAAYIKRQIRRKKTDRRIIKQAKALGAWDKRPTPLGGRALELKAWEDFKIKRQQGETDAELRRRCMAAADMELANTPPEGGKPHGI